MTTDTLDKPDTTELVTIPSETARDVFTDPEKLDAVLAKIRTKIDAYEMPPLTTAANRERVKSFAMKVVKSKTYLDLLAQKEYQEASKVPKLISEARNTIGTKLDAWRDEIRKPVAEWEAKEKARVDKHNGAIGRISRMGAVDGLTVEQIKARQAEIEAITIPDDAGDMAEGYATAKARAAAAIVPMLALREQYEKDQAELNRLREAEQARLAEAAREREAAIRKAAEDAKKVAPVLTPREADLLAQIAAAAEAVDDEPEPVAVPANTVPVDMPIVTPKARNRLATEKLEALRVAVDEALKVVPKVELADALGKHHLRVLKA